MNAFQSYGEFLSGNISDAQRQAIVRHACPGAGACGGMYTANTMASAIEALGMSLPYSSSIPAVDELKNDECVRAGAAIRKLLELDLKPRDIMTRAAFENAIVVVCATGGSTNAVLHLIAIARSVGVPLTIDDFQATSNRIPLLADFKPSIHAGLAAVWHVRSIVAPWSPFATSRQRASSSIATCRGRQWNVPPTCRSCSARRSS